jgi:outer membrane protein assembly factor BamB
MCAADGSAHGGSAEVAGRAQCSIEEDRPMLRIAAVRAGFSTVVLTLSILLTRSVTMGAGANVHESGESKAKLNSPTDDWPAFLGPNGTGVTRDAGIADRWAEAGPRVVWSKKIGDGYSAPSVRGEKLVYHNVSIGGDAVECVRADSGEPVWKFLYPGAAGRGLYGDGPRATPLLTENRCYAFDTDGRLLCLDLQSGKEIWQRDTQKDFNYPRYTFGAGCSPILEGNLLIVLVGGQPNSGVVAFRTDTGKTVWQSVGKETWDGAATPWGVTPIYRWSGNEKLVDYSSPIVATIHGRRHLLCLMRQGLVSLDPVDGRLNFKYWFSARNLDSVTAARPVVIDDRIFLTGSYGNGCALLQVEPSGRDVKKLWSNKRLQAHWSTPIYLDGYLYGFTGRYETDGRLCCIDVATGNLLWTTSGYAGGKGELIRDNETHEIKNRATGKVVPFPYFGRGSLTLVGKRFLVLGEYGTLALAECSPKGYKEICRASFPDLRPPVWPSPVVAGKKVYLRNEHRLLCVDLAPTR